MPIHVGAANGGRKIHGNASSNPGSPAEGDHYWHTSDNVYKYYDGNDWGNYGDGTLGKSSASAATNAKQIYDSGNRTNGYYWIKGDGTTAAREMYCILDAQFAGGGGWMVIANHDGEKSQRNSGNSHQARPTSYTNHVGYDGSSGNPPTSSMVPNVSFSVNIHDVPFTKVAQLVYPSVSSNTSSWLVNPLAYWHSSYSTSTKIPANEAWHSVFNTNGSTLSFQGSTLDRRIRYATSDYNCESWGVYLSSAQSTQPRVNGSSAVSSYVSYPVYCACWTHAGGNLASLTVSWTDYGGSAGSYSQVGFDDFQDGSGMGDDWNTANSDKSNVRGKPSFLMVQ